MNEDIKRIIDKAWANRHEEHVIASDCCGATEKYTGICSDCGEHAEFN